MLTQEDQVKANYRDAHQVPPFQVDVETELDWSGRLSIDLIRQHTKTDDIPGVSDDVLKAYRAAAVEAAERYTGLLLGVQRTVTEPIQGPATVRPGKNTYKFRLRYPVADGVIHVYGGTHPSDNLMFYVPPNTRTINVPIRSGLVDTSNCCDPCSSHHINGGFMALYKAGFASPNDVPAGVVLGCLQYIAWILEHPGDEILTVRNRRDARSEGAQGTNNIAIASGALETWRVLDEDIV